MRRFSFLAGTAAIALMVSPALSARAADRILVVCPFAQSEGVPAGTGTSVAEAIAAEIAALGGVTVQRAPATLKPAQYRTFARDAGADFYFSGSVAPVGGSFSALEQLVTVRGGTVQWSVSTQFRTVADLHGQGALVHDQIIHVPTPQPIPNYTP